MKKNIMWMLIGAMTLSAVGCSSNTSTSSSNTSTSSSSAEKEVNVDDDGREMVGNLYKTGLPLVKEKEKFTIFADDAGLPEDKIMFEIFEEQTNVEVELLLYPYETATERMNILINSGNYPDVIGGWVLNDNHILTDGMRDGLYIPIGDYIDEYAPNMQEMLEIEGVRQTMTLPDGNIYTVPWVIEEPLVPFIPWINTEWLERVGMDMPTNTDEFKEVLIAFRDQDANGSGRTDDEIPFSADPNNRNLGLLAGWFGVNVNETEPKFFAMVDGELEFQANKEGYKEYIKYMNELYEEGLIDPEIFTQDLATFKSKGKQGLYGVAIGYGSGDFYQEEPGQLRGPYDPLPVLTSHYTDEPVYRRGSYGATTFRSQVAITDNAEHPEMIIRWFDNTYEPDNSVQIQWGVIDKSLEKISDTEYRQIDGLSEADKEKYGWGNLYVQSLPKYMRPDLKLLPAEGVPEPYKEMEYADKLYEPYLDETIPQAWISAEDASRIAIIETDIESYVFQKQAQWISGQADVEEEWDEYLEQLDRYGLQELIEIRREAIASMK